MIGEGFIVRVDLPKVDVHGWEAPAFDVRVEEGPVRGPPLEAADSGADRGKPETTERTKMHALYRSHAIAKHC